MGAGGRGAIKIAGVVWWCGGMTPFALCWREIRRLRAFCPTPSDHSC